MGQAKACSKAQAGNGKGLRKHHGPNTGKNRDHVVVPPSEGVTRCDAVIKTAREVVVLPSGHLKSVTVKAAIIRGISVKPEQQLGLLAFKAQLEAAKLSPQTAATT